MPTCTAHGPPISTLLPFRGVTKWLSPAVSLRLGVEHPWARKVVKVQGDGWCGQGRASVVHDCSYLGAVAPLAVSGFGQVVSWSRAAKRLAFRLAGRVSCVLCPLGRRPALLGPARGVAAHFH